MYLHLVQLSVLVSPPPPLPYSTPIFRNLFQFNPLPPFSLPLPSPSLPPIPPVIKSATGVAAVDRNLMPFRLIENGMWIITCVEINDKLDLFYCKGKKDVPEIK